jgi:hypothetical protein
MMDDTGDRELQEALRSQAPPAPFDEEGIRRRVESTLAPGALGGGRRRLELAAVVRASLRLAAALAIFAGGALAGRMSAVPGSPVAIGMIDPSTGIPTVIEPVDVPLSIQSSGTNYVSSLALLSDLGGALTAEQRAQAREVAVAVLSGAIAELLLSDDTSDPADLLRTLARQAALNTSGDDPLLWR